MSNAAIGLRQARAASRDVLQLLLDRKPWTRAELARASSLSRATIVSRLETLREVGLIREVGRHSPEGGRPTAKIALNDRVHTVASVEVAHSSCRVTIGDLGGTVVRHTVVPMQYSDDFAGVLARISVTIRELIAGLPLEYGSLACLTLGLPMSATPTSPGLFQLSHAAGWTGFPAREWLEAELAVPVFVENDANLMALGERAKTFPDVEDLMFVYVGEGIGAGVIAAGRLVRGSTGFAGEIAHIPTPRRHDTPCVCGDYGCLAAVASLPAVLDKLKKLGLHAESLTELSALVAQGNMTTSRVLREAGRDIGDVLIYALSTTNPKVLVIGGPLGLAGDAVNTGIRQQLYRANSPAIVDNLTLARASDPDGVGTTGALALAAGHVLRDGALFALLDEAS